MYDSKAYTIRFIRLLLLGASVLWVSGCNKDLTAKGAASQNVPPKVTVAKPLSKTVVEWDEYTARIQAVESVEVRARVSGYLESIHFREGSVVDEDDLLFVIDPRLLKAEPGTIEATPEPLGPEDAEPVERSLSQATS